MTTASRAKPISRLRRLIMSGSPCHWLKRYHTVPKSICLHHGVEWTAGIPECPSDNSMSRINVLR